MKSIKTLSLAFLFAVVTSLSFGSAHANAPSSGASFENWVDHFKQRAISEGVDPAIVSSTLSNLYPDSKVINYDDPAVQPETKPSLSFAEYARQRVSATRIQKGREMLIDHYDELERIGKIYGVQPQYIVALWGMETNYGGYTGKHDIINSLATLTWHHKSNLTHPVKKKRERAQRRYNLFSQELINTLKIIEQGHYTRAELKGSWAGAFGQVQFMPSSFLRLSADGDGDGINDIRTNLSDIFASAANYLSKRGWNDGQRWGRQVVLPAGFDSSLVGSDKSLSYWRSLGLTTASGQAIPVEQGMSATLKAPDGLSGEVFLVYNNFRTIKRWNNSDKFALSVGKLADEIAVAAPSRS